MAVERLAAVAETLIHNGRSAQTPVSVIADGTLPTQRTIMATLDTVAASVAEDGIRPPAVVVIGEVVNVAAEIAELVQRMPATTGTSLA
jgi:uroporphyrin-III C-methyltransferase / precorrin-2 dehydrogenase / sirohydrochlorin ferrochelatase